MDVFTELVKRFPSADATLEPLRGVSIAFIILNTLFLALRFYTVLELRSTRLALAWDDWLLIPAYVFCILISAMALVMAHHEAATGVAGDELIMQPEQLKPVLKALFALLEFLSPAYAFTRYSIIALYLRLFSGKIIRLLSYVMIALLTAQWIAFAFAAAFQCNPARFYWDRTIPGGECVNIDAFNRSYTPVNIAFDVVILLMPIPTIWHLNASKLRKTGITGIFGIGAIALAASLARLVLLEVNTTTLIAPKYTVTLVSWLVVEPSLYFVTACLPAMAPLLRVVSPSSVRLMVNGQIDEARGKTKRSPSKRRSTAVIQSVQSDGEFERLDDPSDRAMSLGRMTAEAYVTKKEPSQTLGRGKKADNILLEELEAGRAPVRDADLREVTSGGGIIVQTEISVTQEQRIGQVLDF